MSGCVLLDGDCSALLWLSSHCRLPCAGYAPDCALPPPLCAVPRAGLPSLLHGAALLRLLVRGRRASEQCSDDSQLASSGCRMARESLLGLPASACWWALRSGRSSRASKDAQLRLRGTQACRAGPSRAASVKAERPEGPCFGRVLTHHLLRRPGCLCGECQQTVPHTPAALAWRAQSHDQRGLSQP